MQLIGHEGEERLRVEEGFGFLVQERFIRRASALGNAQKAVLIARLGIEFDLRWQIGVCVLFVIHVERGHL